MKKFVTKKTALTFAMAALVGVGCSESKGIASSTIVPKTDGIRSVVTAQVDGEEMLYISEIDGAVSLNGLNGKQSWRNPSDNPALMFEIIAADIDGDKNDDLLGVSGNGSVYAWSSNGKLLWKFSTPKISRLCQIAAIGSGKNMKIFAGGNDYNLYELDVNGKLLSTTPVKGSVLYIESGDFVEDGKDDLFVYTLSHDKYRSEFFGFIDPVTKKVIKSSAIDKIKDKEGKSTASSYMVNDMSVADVDKDGKDDVIMTGYSQTGRTYVVNGNLEILLSLAGSNDSQRYSHGKSTALMPVKDQIVMQYGGMLRVFDLEGNEVAVSGERHKGVIYNELLVVPSQNMLLGAGQVGGDNTLYCYDLNDEKWFDKKHEFDGRYLEVKNNINTLYDQTLNFKRPEYQPKQDNEFIVLGVSESRIDPRVAELTEGKITYLSGGGNFSESTSRDDLVAAIGPDALKLDRRRKYNNTPEEIVEWARKKEEAGDEFEIWVGHGTDPFFIRVETIEKMIEAAPTTCRGLVYAEMANTSDPRVGYFVDEYMPRIAKAIRDNKATTKLYFRYKNMFWAADCHEPIWKKIFFSGKYSDIIAPSAEDTNNRLQDLNFAGRVGMWMSGYTDAYAMRLVDDNPTSWRPYAAGGQRSVSPYLRNAALMAAYGSRHGLLFSIAYLEDPGYSAFFALLNAGVIPTVKREDILSVGSWHLVKNIDQEYLDRVNNGHDLIRYDETDDNAVVSKAGVHWCGADVPSHDYSKIASGVNYRWLNFIPPMPNGMVPFTESEYASTLDKAGVGYVTSDINHGFVDGKKVDGKAFGPVMKKVVEDGAKTLLMRVDGASWGLFKVGENHARLILVDPGYIDPAERDVVITLQNVMPKGAVDILSGEKLSVKGDKLNVTVPAGSMRFIDFEYSEKL